MNNNNFPLQEISIKELYMPANECIYEIPIYQRNYAWGYDEIATLIQDVYDKFKMNQDATYFIGTLVSYKKAENVYEIIDGQQRLTTIRIILGFLYSLNNENEILQPILQPLNSRLTFRAREKSDEALKNIPSNTKEHKLKRNSITSIDDGYKFAKAKFEELSEKHFEGYAVSDFVDFVKFFLNKVHIIHYQVPADIDLNHYFEIMNSRGEQLEKHEIVKAMIIAIFSENSAYRQIVNKIWNACSQMKWYVQNVLNVYKINEIDNDADPKKKSSFAIKIFGDDFNSYTASFFEESEISELDKLFKNIVIDDLGENNDKLTLDEVIDDDKIKLTESSASSDDFEELSQPTIQPIIDFPNLLLVVLKITKFQEMGETRAPNVILDDKELLNEFKVYLNDHETNRKRAEKFIINLLKARYFLDNFIVHRNPSDGTDDDNPWSLEKSQRTERRSNKGKIITEVSAVNLCGDSAVQNDLLKLLSMFEVTYSSRQRKNYLFYCLYYLIQNWQWKRPEDTANQQETAFKKYLRFVNNLATFYFDRFYLDIDKFTYEKNKKDGSIDSSKNYPKNSIDDYVLPEIASLFNEDISTTHCGNDFITIYGDGQKTASNSSECRLIPLFIFNYLDYKIWKLYCQKARGFDNKNAFYELIGCPDPSSLQGDSRFKNFNDKFNNFNFSNSRKSLEHYLPQTNINNKEYEHYEIVINCLGNYGMIGSRANSSGSNWDPKTKISHYLDKSQKIDPVSVSSLKFLIMMSICDKSGWDEPQIRDHQKKMLNILFPKDNEQCHYPNNISLQSEHKDNYKSLRYDKIKDIFSRIKDHLNGQFNASDIKDFDFECEDRKYPQLKFNLRTYDDIVLSLCFEAACKRDESAYFYYGIVVEFVSDYSSDNYSYEAVTKEIQKRKKDIQNFFENESWKKYVSDIPKWSTWVWWKRLPSKSNELNFNILNNYKKLFESSYYETILSEIFSEVDTNLEFIMDNGIPNDLSEVESDAEE